MSLLAPLARLLRTDLNTLLCFREELTKEDVAGYIYEVTKLAWTEGAGSAGERIREIVKEYPSNGELLYQMGTMLRNLHHNSEYGGGDPGELRICGGAVQTGCGV